MEDALKKLLYAGVGLAATATEKIETTVDDLIEKGKISDKEGKKIVDDFIQTSDKKRDEFEGKFKKATEEVVARFNYVKKTEFDALAKKVAKLEKELKKAPAKKSTAKKSTAKKSTSTAAKKTTSSSSSTGSTASKS